MPSVVIEILGKVSDFAAAAEAAVNKATTAADEIQKRFDKVGDFGGKLATAGAGLTAGLTAPIAGIAMAATSMFSDFESSMNRVSALSGATGSSLQKLTDEAVALGASTQFSAGQAAQGMGELAAAGFDVNQISAAMPGVLDLAAAGQMGIAEAASTAANVMSAFGMEAENVGHAADVLAVAASSSNQTVADLANTVRYVGPVANAAGMSLEQVAAATTSLANAGIRGEQGGTALRAIIASLVAPSTNAATVLDRLKVSTENVDGTMRPLNDIMVELREKGATTTDMFTLFGREAASAAATLMKDAGPALDDMGRKLVNSEGAAQKMAATLMQGVGGAAEEFSGAVESAAIRLGEALAPAITTALNAGQAFVSQFLMPAIEWFKDLPDPIRNAAIAVGSLLAALGPIIAMAGGVMMAIGPITGAVTAITGALGVGVVALFGWAAAIAGAVAALVALGTWVAANWDSIVAVVAQAWDGITEMWNAAWGAITGVVVEAWSAFDDWSEGSVGTTVGWLGMIWDGLVSQWTTTWNVLSAVVVGIWNGIKVAAEAVWNGVVWAIGKVVEVAAKIPGANKLLSLDEAWASAKKYKAGAEDAAKASDGVAAAAKGVETETKKEVKAFVSATAAKKDAKEEAKRLKEEKKKLKEETKAATAAWENFQKVVANRVWLHGLPAQAQELNDKLTAQATKLFNLSKVELPAYIAQVMAVKKPVDDVYDALNRMGIKSTESFTKARQEAEDTYKTIMASDKVGQYEKQAALIKYYEAVKAESQATGQKIPADLEAAFRAANGKASDTANGLPSIKGQFTKFGGEVSTIVTNLAQDLGKSLFDGDLSWGGKFKGAFQSIMSSITATFVQPFINAITGENGIIKKAMEPLSASISGISGKLGDLIGVSGNAASNIPGVPGVGGNNPSTPGGAAGAAASGALGWVSAIGSVATAVSSIVSNFQLARQEGTLNAIEHNTRYGMMFLGERADGGIVMAALACVEYLTYVNASLDDMKGKLAAIESSTFWALKKLEGWDGWIKTAVQNIEASASSVESTLSAMRNTPRTVNFYGITDTQEILETLRREFGEDLEFAGV